MIPNVAMKGIWQPHHSAAPHVFSHLGMWKKSSEVLFGSDEHSKSIRLYLESLARTIRVSMRAELTNSVLVCDDNTSFHWLCDSALLK